MKSLHWCVGGGVGGWRLVVMAWERNKATMRVLNHLYSVMRQWQKAHCVITVITNHRQEDTAFQKEMGDSVNNVKISQCPLHHPIPPQILVWLPLQGTATVRTHERHETPTVSLVTRFIWTSRCGQTQQSACAMRGSSEAVVPESECFFPKALNLKRQTRKTNNTATGGF